MQPIPKSHPAVTAAGIVAILFGAFGVLIAIFVELSMLFVSRIAPADEGVPFPEAVRAMASVTWLFLFLLAIFGIFVGAGILRRRNWARISILIWGGLMAFFSAITMVATFFVMSYLPSTLPNAAEAAPVLAVMKWVLALFYAIPLGVGIWWLILFTRKAVVDDFNPLLVRLHPGKTWTLPASRRNRHASFLRSRRARLPLAAAHHRGLGHFLRGFHADGTHRPVFVASRRFRSSFLATRSMEGFPVLFFVLLGIVYAVCGVGIIKLKPWALDPLIGAKRCSSSAGS